MRNFTFDALSFTAPRLPAAARQRICPICPIPPTLHAAVFRVNREPLWRRYVPRRLFHVTQHPPHSCSRRDAHVHGLFLSLRIAKQASPSFFPSFIHHAEEGDTGSSFKPGHRQLFCYASTLLSTSYQSFVRHHFALSPICIPSQNIP